MHIIMLHFYFDFDFLDHSILRLKYALEEDKQSDLCLHIMQKCRLHSYIHKAQHSGDQLASLNRRSRNGYK